MTDAGMRTEALLPYFFTKTFIARTSAKDATK
jgi:hypothetical protein